LAAKRLTRAQVRLRGSLLALAVLAAVLATWRLGLLERAELALLDARFAIRGPVAPSPAIVLVGIDEESAAHFNRRLSSFTRAEYAAAVTNLAKAGASLIVLDVVFARDDPDPNQDAALAAAIGASGRVVLVADVAERSPSFPVAALRAQEIGEGFINLIPDRDGVVRRIPPPRMTIQEGDEGASLLLPVAAEAAVEHLHPEGAPEVETAGGDFRIGGVDLRTSGGGVLIDFAGGPGTIPAIPFWRALEGALPEGSVRGRIVLVGSMNPLQHDQFSVPFRGATKVRTTFRERTEVRQGEMYGIEIHAQALDTILSGRPLLAVGRDAQGIAFLLLGTMSGALLIVLRLRPARGAALAAAGVAIACAIDQVLFVSSGRVVDVLPGALIVLGHFVAGQMYHRALDIRMKREIEGLFGRYVSPQVADKMIRDPSLMRLGGRKAVLTIFFSDIRGFTSMSETLPPDEVASLLQEYFTEMTGIVFKHGGTLDKFIGDAIMVFFGDPVPMEDHAERAVWMSLEMREAMERLKDRWRSQGRRTFDPGIGINTGEVFVGNTGSSRRVSYTVLGDHVNLAARLEANAKAAQILISRATHDAIPGIESKFVVEPLPPIMVKGKAQPVEIYQVVSAR
jgi:adenylate cyclase